MTQTTFNPSSSSTTKIASVPEPTAQLLEYLTTGQNQSFFERLYENEAVVLGMFRLLPSIARQIVMTMLWNPSSLKPRDLNILLKLDPSSPESELETRLSTLFGLHILAPSSSRSNTTIYHLNSSFKLSLINALTGGGMGNAFGVPYVQQRGDESVNVTPEELGVYGDGKWEAMLKFMVSSSEDLTSPSDLPPKSVSSLLLESGLMSSNYSPRTNRNVLQINSEGFQFLLEDKAAQIWSVLMSYLRLKIVDGGNRMAVDILTVYFTLGSMQLGRSYSASALSPARALILSDLEDYGLIYRRARSSKGGGKHDQFYPTALATTLCQGRAAAAAGVHAGKEGRGGGTGRGEGEGFLILETNYRIYAYTSNELEIAILNLFIDILIRYPNLIVGKLERNNVKKAMDDGISANQIISYLTSHAHPQMHKNDPLLPITVVDQLHLWDQERHRLQSQPGHLFTLNKQSLFEECVEAAKGNSTWVYDKSEVSSGGFEGCLFVSELGKEAMTSFIRSRREGY